MVERRSTKVQCVTPSAPALVTDDEYENWDITVPLDPPLPPVATNRVPASEAAERREDPPDVLTADELAELLRLNRKTVYEALARGEIPARRIGATYRIHRDAVLRWLADGQGRAPRSRGSR